MIKSSQILKWQNRADTAFSEVKKYKEIANFLEDVKFN